MFAERCCLPAPLVAFWKPVSSVRLLSLCPFKGGANPDGAALSVFTRRRSWPQETEQEPAHPGDEEEGQGEEDGAPEDQAGHDRGQAQEEHLSKAHSVMPTGECLL